jgi:hypothetical protein
MLLAVLLSIAFTLGGALLSYHYDEDAPLVFRLSAGAVTGSALFAFVGFWLTLVLPFGVPLIALAGLLSAAPLILLRDAWLRLQLGRDARALRTSVGRFFTRPSLGQIVTSLIVAFLLIVLWFFFDRAMLVRPEGIFTGVTNNLGDLPFHLSVITGFTEGNNFPPQDPSYAGARFAYPLLADFVAAAFVRLGASWAGAMFLQNLTLALGLVAILYRFTFKITRDAIAAIIAPFLLLFSGGMGWLMLFRRDTANGANLSELFWNLPHDYSIMQQTSYRWGNALTSLLVTQRSLLFGMPLTILIFAQWWRLVGGRAEAAEVAVTEKKSKNKRHIEKPLLAASSNNIKTPPTGGWRSALGLVPAALLAGMLPLIHAHSFAVVIAGAGALMILFRQYWRTWIVFLAVSLVIAVPQLLWITHGGSVETQSFLGFHFGWDNGVPDTPGAGSLIGSVINPAAWFAFLAFWLRNTGIFIPLLAFALAWMWRRGGRYRTVMLFYVPFVFFFFGPNLIKLAPWVWDNIKVLIYWFVGSIPLVAGLLGYVWSRNRWARVGVIGLGLLLVAAGGLDVWRVVSGATEIQVFDHGAVELADQMRAKLPRQALMLNAPTYNTAVFLTGRRSYLGYTAHVWSHGIDYLPRERVARGIYAGEPGAEELIRQNGIEFVVVGPLERSQVNVNDGFFQKFPVVAEAGNSRVYQVSPP